MNTSAEYNSMLTFILNEYNGYAVCLSKQPFYLLT